MKRLHAMGQPAARHRGFTLIEILVVVAIIALLVSILLPTLKKARDQAKSVACRANLHDYGLAIQQYVNAHDPYYPLSSYIGCSIYWDRPGADDNLFVLYYARFMPNPESFTCPGTTHKVRTPRIKKEIVEGKGVRFNIYCDPNSNTVRNDFEFHGQLVEELVQDPSSKRVPVNGFGTSYEYSGWHGNEAVSTRIDWYPFKRTRSVTGEPRTTTNTKKPFATAIMKDADEGSSMGDVVGAPHGQATNNVPEPWDNHGTRLSNILYADGHVISKPR